MYNIIGSDGQPYGPAGAEQIRQWLAENRANAQTLVRPEGAQEWKTLSSLPEFSSAFKPPPHPGSAVPPTIGALASSVAARASNKVPAGVCGILLGSFGIHKFILGYNLAGIIMLLVTLIGGVLTCGVAAGGMHLIGIIEGLIYLCKPDEEFVRTYVDGRKEWF